MLKRCITLLIVGGMLGEPAMHGVAATAAPAQPAPAQVPPKGAPHAVLSPDKFAYPMKLGYSAAQKYPELINKLFCYCGCDKNDGHDSLLQCYVSTHGGYCAICMEEAIEAKQMKEAGSSVPEIQAKIDSHFAKYYPFPSKPSPQLLKYRESLKASGIKVGKLAKNANTLDPSRNQACCGHQNEGNAHVH